MSRDGREAVLEDAGTLFATYGFKETSIDDVARAARVGAASVYLQFSSKEELLAEVVRRLSERTLDSLATAMKHARTAASKLRAFLETSLNAVPALAAECGLGEKTMTELIPLAMSLRQAHLARERSMLVKLLRDGVASGELAVEHPERLATGIVMCVEALDAMSARASTSSSR